MVAFTKLGATFLFTTFVFGTPNRPKEPEVIKTENYVSPIATFPDWSIQFAARHTPPFLRGDELRFGMRSSLEKVCDVMPNNITIPSNRCVPYDFLHGNFKLCNLDNCSESKIENLRAMCRLMASSFDHTYKANGGPYTESIMLFRDVYTKFHMTLDGTTSEMDTILDIPPICNGFPIFPLRPGHEDGSMDRDRRHEIDEGWAKELKKKLEPYIPVLCESVDGGCKSVRWELIPPEIKSLDLLSVGEDLSTTSEDMSTTPEDISTTPEDMSITSED